MPFSIFSFSYPEVLRKIILLCYKICGGKVKILIYKKKELEKLLKIFSWKEIFLNKL